MVIIYFILGLLGTVVVLIREAINAFLGFLPTLLAGLIVLVVLILICAMISNFISDKGSLCSSLYIFNGIIVVFCTTIGLIPTLWLIYVDHCNRFFTWFGDGMGTQLLTYIAFILIISTLIMVIAYFVPWDIISSILLLFSVAFPFFLYAYSLQICTKSYSDFITLSFTSEDTLLEYRVLRDTKIYYPDYFKYEDPFPVFLPFKYTSEQFNEGEIVYAVYNSLEKCKENGYNYITVSNGSIGGIISVNDLENVETKQYTYEVKTMLDENIVYKGNSKDINSFKLWTRTNEVIDTIGNNEVLVVTDASDGYLRIKLSDNLEGFISCDNVKVIRTPITN